VRRIQAGKVLRSDWLSKHTNRRAARNPGAGALWLTSDVAGICEGAPIQMISHHIEQQQTPH